MHKRYVQPGERVRVVGGYSEAFMHIGLAGRPIEVQLIAVDAGDQTYYSAQAYLHGLAYSGRVTTGEAGFYSDDHGFYVYEDHGPGDEDPKAVQSSLTAMLEDAIEKAGVPVKRIGHLGL